MRLFIDSANIDEIRSAHELGVISGVTTNPSLIAKEGRDFVETVKEIAAIVNGPISAEAVSLQADDIVTEAVQLASIHPNIVVKVPMNAEGLKAVKVLSAKGIKTNVTLIFSANQALLAALAGASYVSPFVGRLDDIGTNGLELVKAIMDMYTLYAMETEVIAASIRHPVHVTEAALAGADIATIPYKIILQMIDHPLTDLGIKKFLDDWQKVPKK